VIFNLDISSSNSAFDEDPQYEVARILSKLCESLINVSYTSAGKLHDYNGNPVGDWSLRP
jgi:hypothetical protein